MNEFNLAFKRNGEGDVVAAPSQSFWDAWRADKATLKGRGYVVGKDDEGRYQISFVPQSSAWVDAVQTCPASSDVVIPATPIVRTLDNSIPWTDEQHAIFEWFRTGKSNAVVRARAGTGKTTTVKAGFSLAPEERMLYAVFNKKNQREAAEKITDQRVEIRTLHSLGFAYIKRVWGNAKPDDAVEDDRIEATCGRFLPDEVFTAIKKLVGFAKNCYVDPSVEDLAQLADDRMIDAAAFEDPLDGGWTVLKIASKALAVLELSKQPDRQNRISFNDMVWLPVVMEWVRPWFDLVCVDEAQDMNLPQLLMAIGACKSTGRIIVIGDDRQAIYGFRGAAHNGLDMMLERLNAVEFGLTRTQRCPKAQVATVVQYVPDYRATDGAPEGLVEDIDLDKAMAMAVEGDAFVSRANAPLMPICLGLLRRGISARIEGRDVGKMLLSIIKKLKAKSVTDFIAKVEKWGDRQRKRAEVSKHAEQKIQVIDDQVLTLIALADGADSVAAIEKRTTDLFSDSDNNPKPAVVLSSVHKAKGLEWNRVFALRETFFRSKADIREEENIFYVAVTRSKKELYFVA